MEPRQALGIMMIVLAAMSPIVIAGVVFYRVMRLRHIEIMTALEKGMPVADLVSPRQRPVGPVWIRYLSLGIGVLVASLGFMGRHGGPHRVLGFAIAGFAACWIARGLLYRRYNARTLGTDQTALEPTTPQDSQQQSPE